MQAYVADIASAVHVGLTYMEHAPSLQTLALTAWSLAILAGPGDPPARVTQLLAAISRTLS